MTAARDGEVTERERRALERHLDRCEACRRERVSLDGVSSALDALPREAVVPARVEDAVFRRVRGLAEDPAGFGGALATWARSLAPTLAATTVVIVAVAGMRARDELGPAPVTSAAKTVAARTEHAVVAHRAKVPDPAELPAALASRPDLFVDLPMLRELDKLQHYDTIATMDDGEPETPGDGASPSSG